MVAMTSNTTPPPYVASASSVIAGPGHEAYRAFDQDINFHWESNGGPTQWVKLDWGAVGGARRLFRYAIVCDTAFDHNRYPKDWIIQGSNDDATWFALDTRSGYLTATWEATPRIEFDYTDTTTAYRYTRMFVTANNGGVNVSVTDFYVTLLGFACRLY